MILGAHESIVGGVSTAFARGDADGARCVQIFTRSARGWASRPLEPAEVERFRAEAQRTGMRAGVHASYLLNLAAVDDEIRRKSWENLGEELARCEALGIESVIFHPGSHADEAAGIELAGRGMAHALSRAPGRVRLLIETTAGQGSCLGFRFEQVAALRDAVPAPLRRRIGVCFDTCHVFAAGYDLGTRRGTERTLEAFDRSIGLGLLEAFHLNDSKGLLGCRVDRHEHIGRGAIGLEAFRVLVNDPRFSDVPGFLETELRFKENLAVLRSLVRS